jgi:hypothetical protein
MGFLKIRTVEIGTARADLLKVCGSRNARLIVRRPEIGAGEERPIKVRLKEICPSEVGSLKRCCLRSSFAKSDNCNSAPSR